MGQKTRRSECRLHIGWMETMSLHLVQQVSNVKEEVHWLED